MRNFPNFYNKLLLTVRTHLLLIWAFVSLTSKFYRLPATVGQRRNQFTVHDKHLPAAGGWLMLICRSDSSCEATAPSGKFTNKFRSQLSNHAALCLREENPQIGQKCGVLFTQTETARLLKLTLCYVKDSNNEVCSLPQGQCGLQNICGGLKINLVTVGTAQTDTTGPWIVGGDETGQAKL